MVEIVGWTGIIFTVVGLFVSSHTLAYYLGHKRGGGQWLLANPFGAPPIKPRVDEQYIIDYEMMKGANSNLNREILNLTMQNKDLEKEIKTLEGKIRMADRRRAKRDETLTALYTASTPEEYVLKYEKSKALKSQDELVDNVKRYARRRATASDAK
jgi:predicted  nucleic acid-binding Zn-ribbon protein